jgi:DNA-binding winged helix-turn-helix (wHTH) protein
LRYRFLHWTVDTDRFELRRGADPVPVQPKVLSLLVYLLEHRDRTVAKRELLDAVWPDAVIGESSLTRAVSVVRSALGETEHDGGVIRTVRGRGYRIGVPVVVEGPAIELRQEQAPASDFVCREQELALARGSLHEALAGRGQLLLLVGEPGIGKTRLAAELASIARQRGAAVLWGGGVDARKEREAPPTGLGYESCGPGCGSGARMRSMAAWGTRRPTSPSWCRRSASGYPSCRCPTAAICPERAAVCSTRSRLCS